MSAFRSILEAPPRFVKLPDEETYVAIEYVVAVEELKVKGLMGGLMGVESSVVLHLRGGIRLKWFHETQKACAEHARRIAKVLNGG